MIVGCGSIGERHLRVFKQLGVDTVPCEQRSERLAQIQADYGCVEGYRLLDEADLSSFEAAIICTDPGTHVDLARRIINAGAHVLVEKPISHLADGVECLIDDARKKERLLAVGYVLRFHPGLEAVKALLQRGAVGRILSTRVKVGTPFDKGRPDYGRTYFARVESGGGVILDGSHELNYLCWLIDDEVMEVACMFDRLGRMKIQTEDITEILVRFRSGSLASVHLDYIQRNYSRYAELIGEEGTILWDYASGSVEIVHEQPRFSRRESYAFERDDLFRKQAANFLAAIKGNEPLRVDGLDGYKTLEICLAARRAGVEGRTVRIGESG